jgi:hypothetical protein
VNAEVTVKSMPTERKARTQPLTGRRAIPMATAESASPKERAACAKKAAVVGDEEEPAFVMRKPCAAAQGMS